MLKKLALAVMIVCGVAAAQNVTAPATLDPGVVYTTGNLVQPTTTSTGSTWVNGVYQDQLTCFAWGNPGYCGPNPIVRPDGNINFSFGWTDLYQQRAIASVLPDSGTGLRVNGYNFGFTAKNGNGWDDGRTDLLFAYVQFNDTKGGTLLNHTNNLSYQFNWTRFEYSKTFDTPFAAQDIGSVRYGFVGKDNNGWAGPYGPEINNVSFSLKYSVDPCATNPLYSPTCPGYMDALNKLLPATVATTEPIATTSTVAATTTEPAIAPTISTSTTTAPSSQPSAVAAVVSAPAPSTTSSSSSSSSASTTASSSSNTRENSGANTSQAMSIISRNQERDKETLSVAQSAVSAAASAAASAQQEAAAVAATAVTNSTSNNAAAVGGGGSAGTGFRSVASVSNAASQTSAAQLMPGVSAVSANAPQTQNTNTSVLASMNTMDTAPVAQIQSLTTAGPGLSTVENNVAVGSNFLTDRANPINAVLEQRLQMPSAPAVAATGPTVNTRVSDNEAAGSVSIAAIAVAPVGYGDYLNFTLRDAAFYAPREVYRNQRNVDNQRALRQLTNDSRHREMVEQQYRR